MGEHKERMLRNDWYLDEPDLADDRRRCRRLLDRFNATGADDDDERAMLLRDIVGHVGVGVGVGVLPRFLCSYGTNITLGDRAFVNHDALFMDDAAITIGDDVRIGPRTQLLTAQHPVDDHDRRREGWERPLPISIGSNTWLGAGVIVCPDVTIGADAVVGARSIVTRDVPDRVLVAGNPARLVREL